MFVLSKRNIKIPAPVGSKSIRLRRGEMSDLPDWALQTSYCQGLISDGKLVLSGKSDRATQAAAEKKVRTRRGAEITEE